MSIAVAASIALCAGVFAAPLTTLEGRLTENRENMHTTVFNWIVANVPEKSGILLEKGGPQLPCKKYKFWKVARNGAVAPLLSSRRFVPPTGIVGAIADLRDIEVEGIDFIVLGQWYKSLQGREGTLCSGTFALRGIDAQIPDRIPEWEHARVTCQMKTLMWWLPLNPPGAISKFGGWESSRPQAACNPSMFSLR
jgi:hypothetical protein